MDLVELGARSMDLVDLEFLELRCLAGKNGVELFLWIWSCVELSQTRPKPATGEGMDKSTFVHTQIQIIIIHFLPSPFPPIPNG
jgi:hypothetical protein